MRFFLAVPLSLLLAACAAPGPVAVAAAGPAAPPKVTCHREAPIGSNLVHTVCETEQTQSEHDAAQTALQEMARANARANPVRVPGQ